MTVYALTITDTELSYDDHSEDFGIGIFSTRQLAEDTAQDYLRNVPGFCEYPCTYRIEEKTIVDAQGELPAFVWMASGWNVNRHQDEVEIVESECFASEGAVRLAFEAMKERFCRTEWVLDCIQIDRREWQEGFCRV